jgi:hypothetical protein
MKPIAEDVNTNANWPPTSGTQVAYKTEQGVKTGTLSEIRWGLVWRDFILDDGRVIAEHKIVGCPKRPVWRNPKEVPEDERQACEEQLVALSESGLDPRDREYGFWAALTQYLAYTYLRFHKGAFTPDMDLRL